MACALVGLVAAVLSVSTVHVSPPGLQTRDLGVAGAEAHILVDEPPPTAPEVAPGSTILSFGSQTTDFETLSTRADLMADLLTSQSVVNEIARIMRVPPSEIFSHESPLSFVPTALAEPVFEKRASELVGLRRPYVLEIQWRPQTPVVDVYAQAPTPSAAAMLATAAIGGLNAYLHRRPIVNSDNQPDRLRLLQLGQIHGVVLSSGRKLIAGLTFVAFFLLTWCAIRIRRVWRRRRTHSAVPDDPDLAQPVALIESARSRWRALARNAGDWPRTTRILPWLLAVFMAMVYLVPFDQITLNVSAPISLPMDRLLLPVIIGIWLVARVVGGPGRPVRRFTWIHAAVGAFMVCALLSVVLNAPELNHDLELMAGIKRIPYLLSYLSVFVIVASVVRATEVNAFLKYMLGLALLCAIGMLVEYQLSYNVFYTLSKQLLPSIFQVNVIADGLDYLGRAQIHGPATEPLEAVTMLALAIPIPLVGLMRSRRTRDKIFYAVAVCLLLSAMVTTYRKSALLVPGAVILTLIWFRPRQMLKMAPLAIVALGVIHVAAPGAFGSITSQLQTNHLNVPTVGDRVVRYDAVYPDVWSHLLFGRGYGTFDHINHRILDSEVLGRTIEMGVIGLIAYLMMMISVIRVGYPIVRARDPNRAAAALVGVCGAVAVLVSSFMYDTFSFPHGAYLFLFLAGFVAVIRHRDPGSETVSARMVPARPHQLHPGVRTVPRKALLPREVPANDHLQHRNVVHR